MQIRRKIISQPLQKKNTSSGSLWCREESSDTRKNLLHCRKTITEPKRILEDPSDSLRESLGSLEEAIETKGTPEVLERKATIADSPLKSHRNCPNPTRSLEQNPNKGS